MNCLVTGAAGFIGSHLCDELLRRGHEVLGVDAYVPYYPRATKERNQAWALTQPNYRFSCLDLCADDLSAAVKSAEVVFHLAAMPGLPQSWTTFDSYLRCNVQATQRLLDAVRQASSNLQRFLYISTSSVYGRRACDDETALPRPVSPYGATKLAAEHLCGAYGESFGLPIVTLRYFSVYGPRQRPDMGYHRFIHALLHEQPITVFGDGQQVRGNTYVSDCVEATLAAVAAPPGETYNVGGDEPVSVWDVLRRLESISGRRPILHQAPPRPGDQEHTLANTTKLRRQFDWRPRVGLAEGLARQWDWQQREPDE